MANKVRISLPEEHSDKLANLPEQGMGYQIVDIRLKSGIWLKNKIVFNSSILEVDEEDRICPEDIISIHIHS
jgi:hypothetical protein